MASGGTCSFHEAKGTSIQRTRSIGGQMSGALKRLLAGVFSGVSTFRGVTEILLQIRIFSVESSEKVFPGGAGQIA